MGAVPILMDDFTTPWNICIPSLSFSSDEALSVEENAQNLLNIIAASEADGETLQASLKNTLMTDFDSDLIAPTHTAAGKIMEIACSKWEHSGRF